MALIVEKNSGILDTLGSTVDQTTKKIKGEKVKKSFISNYIDELRDVSWPSMKQIWRWFLAIIVVCTIMSFAILSFDNLYKGAFKFIECTSPKASSISVNECIKQLPKNVYSG